MKRALKYCLKIIFVYCSVQLLLGSILYNEELARYLITKLKILNFFNNSLISINKIKRFRFYAVQQ